jgi:hypothetical protein
VALRRSVAGGCCRAITQVCSVPRCCCA